MLQAHYHLDIQNILHTSLLPVFWFTPVSEVCSDTTQLFSSGVFPQFFKDKMYKLPSCNREFQNMPPRKHTPARSCLSPEIGVSLYLACSQAAHQGFPRFCLVFWRWNIKKKPRKQPSGEHADEMSTRTCLIHQAAAEIFGRRSSGADSRRSGWRDFQA